MRECRGVNCHEPAAKDGWCGPHYNDNLQSEEVRHNVDRMTAAQAKKADALAKELEVEGIEEMVDLEWWYETYGERARPAKFMNRFYWFYINAEGDENDPTSDYFHYKSAAKLSRTESMLLNQELKNRDGDPVNDGTHIWKYVGKKHWEREGPQSLYACVPALGGNK